MERVIKLNEIHLGDNLKILKMLPNEVVDLIYTDPPFFTQKDWGAFSDKWSSLDEYLEFMRLRIVELYRVLKKTGSFYLHCDWHASHYLKIMCDKIFGYRNFQNEIIWNRTTQRHISKFMNNITDSIFLYTKSNKFTYRKQYRTLTVEELEKNFPYFEEETGRRFQHNKLERTLNSNLLKNRVRVIESREIKCKERLSWIWTQKRLDEKLKKNPYLIYWTKNGRPRYKNYFDEYAGREIANLWTDINSLSSNTKERLDYPTQKTEKLLERIIKASSNKKDIILDAFCGCGTTCAVAKKLNRKYIGIDKNPEAIKISKKRLEKCMEKV